MVVTATDERQAGLVFRTAVRMVELHAELDARVQVSGLAAGAASGRPVSVSAGRAETP